MRESLVLFHERIERLMGNVDFFVNCRVDLKCDKGKGMNSVFNGPDIKTVKAFLVDFRPFFLNKEPINFDNVSNAVYKSISDPVIRGKIADAKKTWDDLLDRKKVTSVGGLMLQINGRKLLSQENLDMWLNAEFFHLGKNKRMLMERINGNLIRPISYFVFIDLLQRLSELLFWFDKNVVSAILEDASMCKKS